MDGEPCFDLNKLASAPGFEKEFDGDRRKALARLMGLPVRDGLDYEAILAERPYLSESEMVALDLAASLFYSAEVDCREPGERRRSLLIRAMGALDEEQYRAFLKILRLVRR